MRKLLLTCTCTFTEPVSFLPPSSPLTGDGVVSSSDGSECFYIPKVDRLVQACTSYLLTFLGICQTSVMRQKDSKETEERIHSIPHTTGKPYHLKSSLKVEILKK